MNRVKAQAEITILVLLLEAVFRHIFSSGHLAIRTQTQTVTDCHT